MSEFVNRFRPLLDRSLRRKLVLSALGAVGIAAVEAIGLVLIVPLVQLITSGSTDTIPPGARFVADRMADPTPLSVAAVLGVIVFAAFVLKAATSLLYLRWNMGVILEAEADTSRRLLRAYLYAPYPFHLQRNSAELQRTVHEDVRRVYQDAVVAFVGGAADTVLIAGVAIVLLVVEPVVALGAAVYFAGVGLGYQRLIHGRASAAGLEIQQRVGDAYRVVQQSIGAVKDIQIRHRQAPFVDELHRVKRAAARRFRTLLLLNQAPRYYLEVALIVGVGLMASILYPLRSTASATAVLSLFVAAGFRLLPSLNRVLVAISAIRASQPALDRVTGDLAIAEPTAAPDGGGLPAPLDPAPVEFAGVSYRYGEGLRDALRDVSFVIEPGQAVAFVGPSGAGKSTLLDVLLGLLEPTDGAVLVGGRPVADVRAAWQRSIGYVPQDVVLLDDPLRTNVALGVPPDEIDEAEVVRALGMAELDDVWQQLPDRLDTRLGERGVRLSGGQRQRVGIARALYGHPAVVVLDEATSSLDTVTEARIAETIDSLHHSVTLVIVTHRLSTVRNCDRIFLLEAGRLVASGSFDELLATSPVFAELVRNADVAAVSADG